MRTINGEVLGDMIDSEYENLQVDHDFENQRYMMELVSHEDAMSQQTLSVKDFPPKSDYWEKSQHFYFSEEEVEEDELPDKMGQTTDLTPPSIKEEKPEPAIVEPPKPEVVEQEIQTEPVKLSPAKLSEQLIDNSSFDIRPKYKAPLVLQDEATMCIEEMHDAAIGDLEVDTEDSDALNAQGNIL